MKVDGYLDTYLANIRKARMEDEMRSSWMPPDPKALHKAFAAHEASKEQDPNGRNPNEPGAKLDSGKIMPWLCIAGFSRALEEVAKVTTLGAQKYTPNGWASVPNGADRYMEAFGRHLLKFGQGEAKDTGPNGLGDVYHKAQMIWNLLASLELELREKNEQH